MACPACFTLQRRSLNSKAPFLFPSAKNLGIVRRKAQDMRRSSVHSSFFSALKQVEKRLKLENLNDPNQSNASNPVPEISPTPAESLGTPIYLQTCQFDYANTNNTSSEQSSEPPQAFLSSSSQFPLTNQDPSQREPPDSPERAEATDDIETLMQLLGLSESVKKTQLREREKVASCGCEGGFYEKILGVKGPKCDMEVERMEGWIRHFLGNGEEPYRLALLLLGKAAFQSVGDCDSGGLEFPSAINGFLKNDPH